MAEIELREVIDIASAAVAPAALQVLQSIERRERPYENFSLAIPLEQLHAPVGTLSVPVKLTIEPSLGSPPHRIDFSLDALARPELFPFFKGTLTISPIEMKCELHL